MILIDCDEDFMKKKAEESGVSEDLATKKISEYKHNVLPVLGYLEDVGKLEIVPVMSPDLE